MGSQSFYSNCIFRLHRRHDRRIYPCQPQRTALKELYKGALGPLQLSLLLFSLTMPALPLPWLIVGRLKGGTLVSVPSI